MIEDKVGWEPQVQLPKWPQMLVSGRPVTEEQAKEIVRRTDIFFAMDGGSGNDAGYAAAVCATVGAPDPGYGAKHDWDAWERWRDRWGFVRTEYVRNSWVASSFVGGPHGWCHPDGTISYYDNVGKWPSWREVMADWETLAREFPFLELGVTLMSGEDGEEFTVPIVSFRVAGGEVSVHDPVERDVVSEYPAIVRKSLEERMTWMFRPGGETGVPWSWIEEWVEFGKEDGRGV